MRRIEYKIVLDNSDEGPFSVASCNMELPYDNEDNRPLSIEMNILRCKSTSGDVNIVCAADFGENVETNFARQYVDALMGQSKDWQLVQFQISARRVILQYYCAETGDVESISLYVDGDPVNSLRLEFKVPHQDGRPSTEYRVDFDYHRICKGDPFQNDVYITERLPLEHRRTLFALSSKNLNEMSVVENVDL